jgi:hypothetical protein
MVHVETSGAPTLDNLSSNSSIDSTENNLEQGIRVTLDQAGDDRWMKACQVGADQHVAQADACRIDEQIQQRRGGVFA